MIDYTKFLTSSSLPYHLRNDSQTRFTKFITTPKTSTPYGHLPDGYREIYLQAVKQAENGTPIPTINRDKVPKNDKEKFNDTAFNLIQNLAEEDKTDVLKDLAVSAGLATKKGHTIQWREKGSNAQVKHFAASLPIELEKIKRGSLLYADDPLETERWNRKSVAVDRAISKVSEAGVVPVFYENPQTLSTAAYKNGKKTQIDHLSFPKTFGPCNPLTSSIPIISLSSILIWFSFSFP